MTAEKPTPSGDSKPRRGLSLTRFINSQGHILTLDQLRDKEPAAWNNANLEKENAS